MTQYIILGAAIYPQCGGNSPQINIMFMFLILGMIAIFAITLVLGHNELEVQGHIALNSKNSKTKRHSIYVRNG